MKIYISYFYKVRFMKPNTIALSTAVWDPKWFHQNRSQKYTFTDERGVVNGLRAEPFVPGINCDGLCIGEEGVGRLCDGNPLGCKFLGEYYRQLCGLNPSDIEDRFKRLGKAIAARQGFNPSQCEYVLLVHEAPQKKCSERYVLQRWLIENGFETEEY